MSDSPGIVVEERERERAAVRAALAIRDGAWPMPAAGGALSSLERLRLLAHDVPKCSVEEYTSYFREFVTGALIRGIEAKRLRAAEASTFWRSIAYDMEALLSRLEKECELRRVKAGRTDVKRLASNDDSERAERQACIR